MTDSTTSTPSRERLETAAAELGLSVDAYIAMVVDAVCEGIRARRREGQRLLVEQASNALQSDTD